MRYVLAAVFALVGAGAIVIAPYDERWPWYLFAGVCALFAAFPFVGSRVQPLIVVGLLLGWLVGVLWQPVRKGFSDGFGPADAITIGVVVALLAVPPLYERIRRRRLRARGER